MMAARLTRFGFRSQLSCLAAALVCCGAWTAQGQIAVDDLSGNREPIDLVNRLLGGGVQAFNVVYTGNTNASGIFCSGTDAVELENGILLTSGDVQNVPGPNDSGSAGTDNGLDGDADLDTLIPGFQTFDASVLEFDFVAEGAEVQFNYVFASEEYNEYVDTSFNDVFGFFVNGVNFALIPGTSTPVSINNVNNGNSDGTSSGPCMNCEFFVDNVGSTSIRNTQMDGLTRVLTFTAPVVPGQTNHLKIAIADAGDGILDSAVFIEAGSLRSGTSTNCITRDARFWFTHRTSANPDCITLERAMERAIATGCDEVDIGFIRLPEGFRNNDNVSDHVDAAIEALGLYYRKQKRTGELDGTQNEGRRGSRLCVERKRLAVEFIAALGNTLLLETRPELCTYEIGGVTTNFPEDLISQARATLAGSDLDAIREFTVLLGKFNDSGVTNNFAEGKLECEPESKKELKQISRDPTSQLTCPGVNDFCEAAEAIYFPNTNDPFAFAKFKTKVDLTRYLDNLPSPTCGTGGAEAIWKLEPPTASAGRRFTVRTAGSPIDTMVSVYSGSCSNLNAIACEIRDASGFFQQAEASFTTDGTNTYFIVVEGELGGVGKLKFQLTSP